MDDVEALLENLNGASSHPTDQHISERSRPTLCLDGHLTNGERNGYRRHEPIPCELGRVHHSVAGGSEPHSPHGHSGEWGNDTVLNDYGMSRYCVVEDKLLRITQMCRHWQRPDRDIQDWPITMTTPCLEESPCLLTAILCWYLNPMMEGTREVRLNMRERAKLIALVKCQRYLAVEFVCGPTEAFTRPC